MSDLPGQEQMQIPLLCSIIRRGGTITFSVDGAAIEDELAEMYELTPEQRDEVLPAPAGTRRWRNHLQWVREKLRERGDIDGSVRDAWTITKQGRERVNKCLIRAVTKLPDDVIQMVLASPKSPRFVHQMAAFFSN